MLHIIPALWRLTTHKKRNQHGVGARAFIDNIAFACHAPSRNACIALIYGGTINDCNMTVTSGAGIDFGQQYPWGTLPTPIIPIASVLNAILTNNGSSTNSTSPPLIIHTITLFNLTGADVNGPGPITCSSYSNGMWSTSVCSTSVPSDTSSVTCTCSMASGGGLGVVFGLNRPSDIAAFPNYAIAIIVVVGTLLVVASVVTLFRVHPKLRQRLQPSRASYADATRSRSPPKPTPTS